MTDRKVKWKEVMAMHEAKDLLQQIKRLDTLISCQQDEADSLMEMMTRVTPVLRDDGASGGGFHDKISGGVAKMVDLRNEINRNIDVFVDTKAKILKLLKRMKQPDHIRVLYLRYYQYRTWEEIAAEMKYSYRGVCYLHGRALVEFESVMKDEGTMMVENRTDRCGYGSQRKNDVSESGTDETFGMA